MEKIKIGNVEFKSRAVLAPMAGVTDRAYRELCVEFGAAYCVSEMVSSKALSFNSKKSEELMEISNFNFFHITLLMKNKYLSALFCVQAHKIFLY